MAVGVALSIAAYGLQAQQSSPDMTEMPGMAGMKMEQPKPKSQQSVPAAADAASIKLPIQELQEPEAVGFQTGADLPAPELLGRVVSREPMSLESFLAMADRANPTLAQAQQSVERSKQQARQVSLPPNPIFGYSGDHMRGGEYGGGEQGAFFSQEFVLAGKLALRRDIYRAEGRSNELAVEVQRARIHNDVGRAFFDTLAAQLSVVVRDRLLKVALDAETNAHELERVGQDDASDVLNAEIAAEQAKIEFVNAQRTFLADFAQLATYAGQTSLAPHPLTGELVEPPVIDAENMALNDTQQSPAVKQAQANMAVAEARMKSAKREKIPNLNLKAGEWYSREHLGATNIPAGPESFVEAGIQVPLWNRNQGNIELSKVELERSRQEVSRTELFTRNRAEFYAQQYQTARYAAERYRNEMLPRARRAYELEVTKYQQMGQAYPHVLTAQNMLFTLQLTYIKALNDEWRAAIALQNYTLMDALDEPMSIGQDSTTMNLPTAPGGGN
jgi:cobalt-zinc-cadmium efflux system outer membrane protein